MDLESDLNEIAAETEESIEIHKNNEIADTINENLLTTKELPGTQDKNAEINGKQHDDPDEEIGGSAFASDFNFNGSSTNLTSEMFDNDLDLSEMTDFSVDLPKYDIPNDPPAAASENKVMDSKLQENPDSENLLENELSNLSEEAKELPPEVSENKESSENVEKPENLEQVEKQVSLNENFESELPLEEGGSSETEHVQETENLNENQDSEVEESATLPSEPSNSGFLQLEIKNVISFGDNSAIFDELGLTTGLGNDESSQDTQTDEITEVPVIQQESEAETKNEESKETEENPEISENQEKVVEENTSKDHMVETEEKKENGDENAETAAINEEELSIKPEPTQSSLVLDKSNEESENDEKNEENDEKNEEYDEKNEENDEKNEENDSDNLLVEVEAPKKMRGRPRKRKRIFSSVKKHSAPTLKITEYDNRILEEPDPKKIKQGRPKKGEEKNPKRPIAEVDRKLRERVPRYSVEPPNPVEESIEIEEDERNDREEASTTFGDDDLLVEMGEIQSFGSKKKMGRPPKRRKIADIVNEQHVPKRGRPRREDLIMAELHPPEEIVEIPDSDDENQETENSTHDIYEDPNNLLVEMEAPPSRRRKNVVQEQEQVVDYQIPDYGNIWTHSEPQYEADSYYGQGDEGEYDDTDYTGQAGYSQSTKKRKRDAKYLIKKDPILPKCNHSRNSNFRCSEIKQADAKKFSDLYYENVDRISQNRFLAQFCKYGEKTTPGANVASDKHVPILYKMKLKNGRAIKVCQRTFLELLHVPRCRIMQVCKNLADLTQTVDRRGGHRWATQYDQKKESVLTYINQYRDENDYSDKPKVYLPCTIKNLVDHYNSEAEEDKKVLYGYFRGLIATYFDPVFTHDQTLPIDNQQQDVINLDEENYGEYNDGSYYGYNGDNPQEEYETQEDTYQAGISNLPESILGD